MQDLPLPSTDGTPAIDLPDAHAVLTGLTEIQWLELQEYARQGATLPEIASRLNLAASDLTRAAAQDPVVTRQVETLLTHAHGAHAQRARQAITNKDGTFSQPAYEATLRNLGREPKLPQTVVHVHASADNPEQVRRLIDMTKFQERFAQWAPDPEADDPPATGYTADDLL